MQDKTGSTKRDTLMQVLQNSEEGSDLYESALAQLEDQPEIPFYLEHIWEWFWQLRKRVPSGMSGQNPITWQDIQSWSNILQTEIRPIEAEILAEIDDVYLKYVSDKQKKEKK